MKLVCVRVEGLEGRLLKQGLCRALSFAELCRKHFIEQIWKSKT